MTPAIADLLKPLAARDAPYEIEVRLTEGVDFPRHAAHTTALALSRKLKAVVIVRRALGQVVRSYDARAIDAAIKAARAARPKKPKP